MRQGDPIIVTDVPGRWQYDRADPDDRPWVFITPSDKAAHDLSHALGPATVKARREHIAHDTTHLETLL